MVAGCNIALHPPRVYTPSRHHGHSLQHFQLQNKHNAVICLPFESCRLIFEELSTWKGPTDDERYNKTINVHSVVISLLILDLQMMPQCKNLPDALFKMLCHLYKKDIRVFVILLQISVGSYLALETSILVPSI